MTHGFCHANNPKNPERHAKEFKPSCTRESNLPLRSGVLIGTFFFFLIFLFFDFFFLMDAAALTHGSRLYRCLRLATTGGGLSSVCGLSVCLWADQLLV